MGKMLRERKSGGIKMQTQANVIMAVIYQLTASICSLILPRYILLSFGSEVNGMLQLISQILAYAEIMEFGVGGLITASFYKPLAEKDSEAVSDIFNNTKRFFGRISFVYIVLALWLAVCAKAVIKTDFDFWYVSSMVIILGAGYYFSNYFAAAHRILIRADQKIRIIQATQSITLVLNLIMALAAMSLGAGIHTVKIINTFTLLINPVVFRIYVKKHYSISRAVYDKGRAFPKKSDGMIHHIAYFIHLNTDIVLLSIFCGTKEVSVYSVYHSIIYAVETLFMSISNSVSAAFGNLIAKDEKCKLEMSFEFYQTANTAAATGICIAEAVLIVPFVRIYTAGVTDVNYIRPAFAYTIIAAQWFYCVRIPYNNVITAAGHYRQTKFGAYMEVILNMGISVIALRYFGLVGVALGTAAAMAARGVYMAWYLSKNILCRKLRTFFKDLLLNVAFGVTLICILSNIITISADNLFVWAAYAAVISIIIIFAVIVFNLAVNRKTAAAIINNFIRR